MKNTGEDSGNGTTSPGDFGEKKKGTHSVSLQSRKASSTTLTRHTLQSRRTLSSGGTRGTSVSLEEERYV